MSNNFLSSDNENKEREEDNPRATLRKKRQKKMIFITVALLLVFSSGVYGYEKLFAKPSTTQPIRLVTVKRGDVSETVSATGTVQATKRVTLDFPINSEKVTSLNVKIGDRVKSGQVLASLNSTSLELQVKNAQANLLVAKARLNDIRKGSSKEQLAVEKASLEKEKLTLSLAQKNYEEQQKLFDDGKIDELQLEQAKNNVNQSQASYNMDLAKYNELNAPAKASDVQNAQVAIDQATYQLQQQQISLANAELKAPMDGVIVEVNGEVGEMPGNSSGGSSNNTSSKSSGFIVMDNSNSGQLKVTAQISQNDIGKIKVGMDAMFTTTAFEGKEFVGKVSTVYPEATTASGVTTYNIELSIDNKDLMLMPGMTVNVIVKVGNHKNTLYIPVVALKEQEGKMGVFVTTTPLSDKQTKSSSAGNITKSFQPVSIGYYSTDIVEVTSGLKEGDQVIIEFQNPASNNSSNSFRIPGMGGSRDGTRGKGE